MYFGVGMTVQQLGIKAGFGFWPTTIIFATSIIFWLVILFTSMQRVKDVLYKKDDKTEKV